MSHLVFVSRSFVEFGPFKTEEIQDFRSRGLLNSLDFLRAQSEEEWTHIDEWFSRLSPTPVEKASETVAKATPKKKASAKKTSKTAGKKSAAE